MFLHKLVSISRKKQARCLLVYLLSQQILTKQLLHAGSQSFLSFPTQFSADPRAMSRQHAVGVLLDSPKQVPSLTGFLEDCTKQVPGLTGFLEDCTDPDGREERLPCKEAQEGISQHAPQHLQSLLPLSVPSRQDVKSPGAGVMLL